MKNPVTLILLVLAFSVSVYAQRNWASASEYDLFNQIVGEKDANRQLELLKQWESRYPNTEFRRERILTMALAYERVGQSANAFFNAKQLLNFDSSDISALGLIVKIGPSLQTPSPDQIRITEEAANRILLQLSRKRLESARSPEMPVDTVSGQAKAPEEKRVDGLLGEMRHGKRDVDVEALPRSAAESALDWVRSVKKAPQE
ncbi:MAG TPA: hypothetical protein VGK34_09715 [Armatimonadota bacterium]